MTAAVLTIRIPNLFLITVARLPRVSGRRWSAERAAREAERERAWVQKALETRLSAHLLRDVGVEGRR